MAAIRIDEKFFRTPQFRPPQVLRICQVDRVNLLDWHRRELIPDTRSGVTGRGHRRLYSVRDAVYINTVRILAEADAPLEEAALLAADLVDAVQHFFLLHIETVKQRMNVENLPDCIAVLYRFEGGWHHRWFGINGEPFPYGTLQGWMRSLIAAFAE